MKHLRHLFLFVIFFPFSFFNASGNEADNSQNAILLIHGIAGASSTWNTLIQAMQSSPYQYISNYKVKQESSQKTVQATNQNHVVYADKPMVFSLDFSDNQNLTFIEQGEEVALVINQIRKDYQVGNVLLIGHSMGGLAARAYINKYGPDGLAGLVTITTPHLGSYLGYFRDLYYHCKGLLPILNTMQQFFSSVFWIPNVNFCSAIEVFNILANRIEGLDLRSKAVDYLTPDSKEMLELNSHPFPGSLPVANIVSKWETDNNTPEVLKKGILTSITKFLQYGYNPEDSKIIYFSDALNAIFNDGIVPVSSQYMKLAVTNGFEIQIDSYFVSCFHTDSPKETTTIFSAINGILKTEQSAKKDKKNIVFILDSSGSMKESDPDKIRLNALASLVGEMELFDNIFIVDFDDQTRWLNSENYFHPDMNRLKDKILSIDAEGGTNIGQALRFTSEKLQKTNLIDNTTVVLLTDGMGDYSGEAGWFSKEKIPVFTISLMDKINEKLLDSIARETNGIYFKAHSEFDIIDAYYSITSHLSSMSMICKARSSGVGLFQKTFRIEQGISSLRVSLFSNNAISDVTIIPPETTLSSGQKSNNPVTPFYYGTKIENPQTGFWIIRYMVKGGSQLLNSESQLMVSAKGKPIVFCSARLMNNNSIEVLTDKNTSAGSIKINGQNVSVLTPLNKTMKVETLPGEEINFHPSDGAGTYKIDMQLFGTIDEQPFERFFTFSILNAIDGQIKAPRLREMLGSTADIETNTNISEIGDEYFFYCIEPANERLIAKGIVTSAGKNNCTVELTETLSSACNNGQIIPVLKKINK